VESSPLNCGEPGHDYTDHLVEIPLTDEGRCNPTAVAIDR